MRNYLYRKVRVFSALAIISLLGAAIVFAADLEPLDPKADVKGTRHNLSASNRITPVIGSSFGTTVKTTDTTATQICVFCHTPHGATTGAITPLWNRALSSATYTFYTSTSLDSAAPNAVGDGSKLCLSCHDGTIAIGTVGVLNNTSNVSIPMQGTDGGFMPPGNKGANTGFTRRIGVDLSNDHPISFTYDTAQADRDGELYKPGTMDSSGKYVAVDDRAEARTVGRPKPQFPLVKNGSGSGFQMECITCHDPHLKTKAVDQLSGKPINNKFLRGNRFQIASPTPTSVSSGTITSAYDPAKDIICLACHNKPTWATSTHANVQATDERYKSAASDLRDFPRDISTWQAACANCHDMHTVPGARRLLREGTDASSTLSIPKDGGKPAVEQVCFQCHSPSGDRILVTESPDQVPDIKTAFGYTVHMPIVTAEQGSVPIGGGPTGNTVEIHNIGIKTNDTALPASSLDSAYGSDNNKRGKDFMELRSQMGAGNLNNRHAECTDCHQPHRVTRTVLFNGDPTIPAEKGTHRHGGENDVGGVAHNNIASGSQRGQFGVEPVYASNSFYDDPNSFVEKRGAVNTYSSVTAVNFLDTDTGSNNGITNVYDVDNTYLTREYQVCAKCHSNYAFGDLTGVPIANPVGKIPPLGRNGGTPAGTNGMMFYTNIFREIQAPVTHRGEAPTAANDSGAFSGTPPYTAMRDSTLAYTVDFRNNNHRSWHPVMGPTGRTPEIRGGSTGALTPNNWLAPWDAIGKQTMYCTDCHGSKTPAGFAQQAVDGEPEGPHGSDNIFLLKGWWDNCTGKAPNSAGCLDEGTATVAANKNLNPAAVRPDDSTTDNDLCFKCHSPAVYRDGLRDGVVKSGFSGDALSGNGHGHSGMQKARCMYCHVAIPHGWKNKAFLVNLNDVGPEATCRQEDADDAPVGYKCSETVGIGNPMPPGTQVRIPTGTKPDGSSNSTYWKSRAYSNPPYYRRAVLKIASFAKSGEWSRANCGSAGAPGGAMPQYLSDGAGWMRGLTGEGCLGVP